MATTIAKLSIDTTLDSSGVAVGAAKTQGILGRLGSALSSKLGAHATAAGGALLAAGTAAFSFAKGVEQVKAAADRVDRMGELSERYNIEAEAIQRLGIAAKLGATDQETLMKAIQKMSLTIGTGGMSLDQRFLQQAKALSAIDDPGERAARIMQIFGKSGLEASNLILTGAAEVEKAEKIVSRFGIGLSQIDVDAVAEMNDKWDEFAIVVDGIWQKVAVQLAPVVTDFLELSLQGIDDMGDALAAAGLKWEHVGTAARMAMTQVAITIGGTVAMVDKLAAKLSRTQAMLLKTGAMLTRTPGAAEFMRKGAADLEKQAAEFDKRAADVLLGVGRFVLGIRDGAGGGDKRSVGMADFNYRQSRTAGVERGTVDSIKALMGISNGTSGDVAKDTAAATKRTADGIDKLVRMLDGGDVTLVPADL